MTWLPVLPLTVLSLAALFAPSESHYRNGDEVKVIVKVPLGERGRYGYHNHGRFVCPSPYGSYPHRTDCSSYYVCRRGWPTLMTCRVGELFDVHYGRCLSENRAVCVTDDRYWDRDDYGRDRNLRERILDRLVVDNRFKCPYEWGTFAHPIDCSKFYVCVRHIPTVHQCAWDELFDVKSSRCLKEKFVNCGNRLDRDGMKRRDKYGDDCGDKTVDPNTVGMFRFVCPCPNGRFPDPEDCSRFYVCRNNVPSLHKCPINTLYDERREQCMEKELVNCGGRPGGVGGGRPEDFICPFTWGTFPHPTDCSKYIICIYGLPTVYTCGRKLLYDAYQRRCLPQEVVDCGDRLRPRDPIPPPPPPPRTEPPPPPPTRPPPPVTMPPKPSTTTAPPPPPTKKPETAPPPRPTPSGKKPNTPPPHDCDEDDIDCIIDITGDPAGWFDCPGEFGHYPHGGSRKLFIHCDRWHPFVKKCPEHTVFSPVTLVCVWPGKEGELTN